MRATTVTIGGELRAELERIRKPCQSISLLVRCLLEHELVRRRLSEAADRYSEFLRDTPAERRWLLEWGRADLATPPRRRSGSG